MCSLLSRENVFVKFSVSKRGKTNLSVVEEHTLNSKNSKTATEEKSSHFSLLKHTQYK